MRPRQRLVLLLNVGEQAHVLDGDDGLVGEGSYQANLLVSEWLDLQASYQDCTDCSAFTEKRHRQNSADTGDAHVAFRTGKLVEGRLDIRNVDDPRINDRAAGDEGAVDGEYRFRCHHGRHRAPPGQGS